MIGWGKICIMAALITLCCSCGHTRVNKIALLSVGNLESRTIPCKVNGPILVGKDTCKAGGDPYYLSEAVRDALKGTKYDTIVDAEVTTKTGLLVWSNGIEVKGKGVESASLPIEGGAE